MRKDLAEKLELIGQIFEIEGMSDLCNKFEPGMSPVTFNAVVIQVAGLLTKNNEKLADYLVAAHLGIDGKEVAKMEDGDYGKALKEAIVSDVIGFFA